LHLLKLFECMICWRANNDNYEVMHLYLDWLAQLQESQSLQIQNRELILFTTGQSKPHHTGIMCSLFTCHKN
jgi:hypothetical protein